MPANGWETFYLSVFYYLGAHLIAMSTIGTFSSCYNFKAADYIQLLQTFKHCLLVTLSNKYVRMLKELVVFYLQS